MKLSKILTLILTTVILYSCGQKDQNSQENRDLPELNVIKQVKLSNPYSCNGSYEKSAVFLSNYSKDMNAPDLLYNGACNSGSNYIEARTASDAFSLISDLGEVDLATVTASRAFNLENTVGRDNLFKLTADLKIGHTYAASSSKSDIRSLVIYTVIGHTQDGELILNYTVKSYSIQ